MAGRIIAAILIVVFAWFLFIATKDIPQLVGSSRLGDVTVLLFCAVVCLGGIGFFALLCWPLLAKELTRFAER